MQVSGDTEGSANLTINSTFQFFKIMFKVRQSTFSSVVVAHHSGTNNCF